MICHVACLQYLCFQNETHITINMQLFHAACGVDGCMVESPLVFNEWRSV